jgi:hypothetical protein
MAAHGILPPHGGSAFAAMWRQQWRRTPSVLQGRVSLSTGSRGAGCRHLARWAGAAPRLQRRRQGPWEWQSPRPTAAGAAVAPASASEVAVQLQPPPPRKRTQGGCRHVAAQKKLKQLHQQQSWVDVPPHGGSAPPPSRGCFLCRFPWSSEFPKGDTTGSGSSRLSAFKSPKLSKVPACTFNAGGASPSCGTQQWGNAATWRQ